MIFAGAELARRIEAAEALNGTECALVSEAVAGGVAIFAGSQSPLTQAIGLGFSGPVVSHDLDRLEAFFAAHGARPSIDLCPFADPSLVEQLGARGYAATEFNNVLIRPLDAVEIAPPAVPVRRADPEELELWAVTVGRGFLEHDDLSAEEREIGRTVFRMPSAQCYFAVAAGQPAAAAALSLRDGLATLFADGTVPAFRRSGFQSALIAERLRVARSQGCDLAAAATMPGSASQRNYERCGFQPAYTKVTLVKR